MQHDARAEAPRKRDEFVVASIGALVFCPQLCQHVTLATLEFPPLSGGIVDAKMILSESTGEGLLKPKLQTKVLFTIPPNPHHTPVMRFPRGEN